MNKELNMRTIFVTALLLITSLTLNAKQKNSINEEEVFFNKNIKGKLFYCNTIQTDFKDAKTLIFKEDGTVECEVLFDIPSFWKNKGKTFIDSHGIKIFDEYGVFKGLFKFKLDEDFIRNSIKLSNFYGIVPESDFYYYNWGDKYVSISRNEKEYNERQRRFEEKYFNSFDGSWQSSDSYGIKNIVIKIYDEDNYFIKINELSNSDTEFNASFSLNNKYEKGKLSGIYSYVYRELYEEVRFHITKIDIWIENGHLILEADFASNPGTELKPESAIKGHERIELYNVSKEVENIFK